MAPLEVPRDRRRTAAPAAPTTPAPAMPGPAEGGAEEGSRRCDRRALTRHTHLGISAQKTRSSRRAVVVWTSSLLVPRKTLTSLLSLV